MSTGEAIGIILGFIGLVCAGIATWISMVVKVARLEEKVRIEGEHYRSQQAELKDKLDGIFEELKLMREELHRNSGRKQ